MYLFYIKISLKINKGKTELQNEIPLTRSNDDDQLVCFLVAFQIISATITANSIRISIHRVNLIQKFLLVISVAVLSAFLISCFNPLFFNKQKIYQINILSYLLSLTY